MKPRTTTLFLDMDGVFNVCAGNETTFKMKGVHFDEKIVKIFNDFLDNRDDIKLVISSSWRDDLDDLKVQLEKAGFKFWYLVNGRTPMIPRLRSKDRGELIWEFIKARGIVSYYIIDDYIDNIVNCPELDRNRVIQTVSTRGLTLDDLKIIK